MTEQLIKKVKQMALGFEARGARGMIDHEDLLDVALMEIVRARARFDESKGSWKAFALRRAFGAMLDECREVDFVPRQVRMKAKHQGISLPMMLSLQQAPIDLVPRDLPARDSAPPYFEAGNEDYWRRIRSVLPGLWAEVVERYFRRDQTLAEIARAQGRSESRVCQILASALKRLRKRLPRSTEAFS